jgi:hypothetical protein
MPEPSRLGRERDVADYKEVRVERLYVKVPGTDRLRRNAAGRLRHLLSGGWREMERTTEGDFVRVRLERSGHAPLMIRLPKIQAVQGRPPRQGQGGFGQRGGPGQGARGRGR